jgi:hypothetical protein
MGRFEFRVGDEVASLVDGEARPGSIEQPDVVIEGDPDGIYWFFTEGRSDGVSVEGNHELLEQLLHAAPQPVESPVSA